MGLTVTSDEKGVKVIRKDKTWSGGTFATYSLMISSKVNDEWLNGFTDCVFKKGVEVENKAIIKINNAFYTVSKSGDRTYVKLMITDFDVIKPGVPLNKPTVDSEGFMQIPDNIDEELPFK